MEVDDLDAVPPIDAKVWKALAEMGIHRRAPGSQSEFGETSSSHSKDSDYSSGGSLSTETTTSLLLSSTTAPPSSGSSSSSSISLPTSPPSPGAGLTDRRPRGRPRISDDVATVSDRDKLRARVYHRAYRESVRQKTEDALRRMETANDAANALRQQLEHEREELAKTQREMHWWRETIEVEERMLDERLRLHRELVQKRRALEGELDRLTRRFPNGN